MTFGRRAYKRYTSFHGKHPRYSGKVNFPEPESLVFLGRAVSIVYESDKHNGGGDGKKAHYEHHFSRGTMLFCDETGRGWIFIHGPRLKVEEPGIIN